MARQMLDMARQMLDMARQMLDMARQMLDMARQMLDMARRQQRNEMELNQLPQIECVYTDTSTALDAIKEAYGEMESLAPPLKFISRVLLLKQLHVESPRSPHPSEQHGDSTVMKVCCWNQSLPSAPPTTTKSFIADREWQEMEQAIDCELAAFINIESRRSGKPPTNILADVVNHWSLKQDIVN
ncbi:hypothetical protein LSAT2_031776 [Lamellibrachia satsuma]|nr:hypothetical protein LSAT2_031776 [Lamellibrachia satsuma]